MKMMMKVALSTNAVYWFRKIEQDVPIYEGNNKRSSLTLSVLC